MTASPSVGPLAQAPAAKQRLHDNLEALGFLLDHDLSENLFGDEAIVNYLARDCKDFSPESLGERISIFFLACLECTSTFTPREALENSHSLLNGWMPRVLAFATEGDAHWMSQSQISNMVDSFVMARNNFRQRGRKGKAIHPSTSRPVDQLLALDTFCQLKRKADLDEAERKEREHRWRAEKLQQDLLNQAVSMPGDDTDESEIAEQPDLEKPPTKKPQRRRRNELANLAVWF